MQSATSQRSAEVEPEIATTGPTDTGSDRVPGLSSVRSCTLLMFKISCSYREGAHSSRGPADPVATVFW